MLTARPRGILFLSGRAPANKTKGQEMFNKLHGEVTDVVYILETIAHGVVDTNVPEYHDVMKAVIMECVFKLEAILAFEDEIQAAFGELDLTDEF